MGMAASQARFLSLTARKSNVEYEGQQVNQQRTALANESANLYNKLTSIKVPTPPSTSDYYETVYTFKANDLDKTNISTTEYTLLDVLSLPDGYYAKLQYLAYQWEPAATSAYSGTINRKYDTETGESKTTISLVNGVVADAVEYNYEPAQTEITLDFSEKNAPDGTVSINGISFELNSTGNQILGDYDATTGKYKYAYDVTSLGNGKYQVKATINKDEDLPDTYICSIAGQEYEAVLDPRTGLYTCVITSGPSGTGENLDTTVSGRYVDPEGNANSAISYLGDEFTSYRESVKEDDGSVTSLITYNQPVLAYVLNNTTYFISAKEYDHGKGREFSSSSYVHNVGHPKEVELPCLYTTAATGRYKTLTVTDEDGRTHTYDLTVTSVQDEEAYEQAMLDYEYEQARYSKQVADINAKTEALQKEDRTLELRLKQLDTEQNAIKTEMDAVSKVIEDNIESTFKTFA